MRVRALGWVLLAGCGLPEVDSVGEVVRSDSLGVEIVMSKGPDRPLRATAERLFVVGGEDEGFHSLFRIAETGIGGGPSGELVVLDPGNFRVVVFDSAGTALGSFGRSGEGPGEFGIPSSLFVDEGGRVHVFDAGSRMHMHFDIDGTLVGERPVPGRSLGGRTRPLSGGVTYGSFNAGRTEWELRLAIDDSLSVLRAWEAPAPREVHYESCGIRMSLPPILSVAPPWDAGAGRVGVVRPPAYEVVMGGGPSPDRILRRAMDPRPSTVEDVLAHLGEGEAWTIGGSRDCVVPTAEAIEQRGVSEWLPLIWGLRVAPDGGLWVERFDPIGESNPIDLFDPDGAYRGTLPYGFPWPGVFLSGDRFAVVETNEYGVQTIAVYRFRVEAW